MLSLTEMKTVPMLVVGSVFLGLSWMTVLLRIYVRAYMIRAFGWDDWIMLLTQILFTAMCSLVLLISSTELRRGISAENFRLELICMVASLSIYVISTVTLKLSLAIFFLRIVRKYWQRYIIYASAAVYTAIALTWFFLALFQCGNPGTTLTDEMAGKCTSFEKSISPLNYVHGVLNAITDWVFALVPICLVQSNLTTRREKLSVIGILFLGAGGSLCSVVRLAYIDVLRASSFDMFYSHTPRYIIVSMAEVGFGIIAASMATFRPLFSRFMDKPAINGMESSWRGTNDRGVGSLSPEHGIVTQRSINLAYTSGGGGEVGALDNQTAAARDLEANWALLAWPLTGQESIASLGSSAYSHCSTVEESMLRGGTARDGRKDSYTPMSIFMKKN